MKATYTITCPDCKSKLIVDWGNEFTCAACSYGWDADIEANRRADFEEAAATEAYIASIPGDDDEGEEVIDDAAIETRKWHAYEESLRSHYAPYVWREAA